MILGQTGPAPAVVIGGGFSGALVAAHLARLGVPAALVERAARVGRGAAYRDGCDAHVLNVPAGRMSAWPDRPDDFLSWLRQEQADATPGTFARRGTYGRYVESVLGPAVESGGVRPIRGEAVDLEARHDGFVVALADGRRLAAGAVVLALGNAAPRPLWPATDGSHLEAVVENPFDLPGHFRPGKADAIALAGTGLTALDMLGWLREQGHRGPVVAFSRHGYMPLAHRGAAPASLPALPDAIRRRPTVRRLMTWLRHLAASLQAFDFDQARSVDALRPITSELWRHLPADERRRFLRHARVLWDLHRHRAPAAAQAPLVEGLREGRIDVRAARLCGVRPRREGGLHLQLRPRGASAVVDLDVRWLVNCTGPERDLSRQRNPLVASLLERGLVQPDALRLGAVTGPLGELMDAAGRVVPGAFVVGGWRMADLFESTAVPELRVQAAHVAERLAAGPHMAAAAAGHSVPIGASFSRKEIFSRASSASDGS